MTAGRQVAARHNRTSGPLSALQVCSHVTHGHSLEREDERFDNVCSLVWDE